MKVEDLNKKQLHELKERYLIELDDTGDLQEVAKLDSLSYGVLAYADDYVSDEFILEHYAGVEFSEDDFNKDDYAVCPRCGQDLMPELEVGQYAYYCPNCDENFYDFEAKHEHFEPDFSDLKVEVEQVECDDMGDSYWQYYAVWRDADGNEVWSDYFHIKPDEAKLDATLESAWKQGQIRLKLKKDEVENG